MTDEDTLDLIERQRLDAYLGPDGDGETYREEDDL